MKSTLTLVVLSMVILMTSACKHNEGAYGTADPNLYNQEVKAQFILLDKRTQNSIKLAGPIQRIVKSDGRLTVNANIMNRENRRIQVQVQCVFKDEEGHNIGDETNWQNVILTENSVEGLSFSSISSKAAFGTIRVRQVR